MEFPSNKSAASSVRSSKKLIQLSLLKATLLSQELQNKAALEMGSNPLSGRQLPFSSLSDKLENNEKKTKKK